VKVLLAANVRWWNAEAAYAWEKAMGLRLGGHQVSILGLTGSPLLERASREGFAVYGEDGLNALNPLSWVGTIRRIRGYLRREGFDVIDAHRSEGFVLLAAALRGSGAVLVRTRGDMRSPRRDPVNRLVHVYACDGLAASGKVVAEGMADAFNLPLSRIEVIYYGVDAVHFSPDDRVGLRREWGVGSDDFLIGMVGRVDRVKGLGNFLHAAALAGHDRPHARFLLAVKEDHPDLPTYRDMIEKLNLEERVTVLGFRKDIVDVYRALDAVVVASLGSEANCRVTLEAMATGKPVIGTTVGVIPEVLQNGVCGYTVAPAETGPLVEALEDFLDHPEMAREMGRKGRRIVEERYTRALLARLTESFYRRLIAGKGAAGE
jgi:glycosyltransferase involved in cell wall biosynthesis